VDIRENILDDPEEPLRIALDGARRSIMTAIPVQVTEDSDGKTVKLRSTIKGQTKDKNGKVTHVDISTFEDVPIHFLGGGGEDKNSVVTTHPIKKGKDKKTADEGLAIFTMRPHDTWFENGEIQDAQDLRMHNLSDAVFIPGLRSKPRALKNISTTSHQVRSVDAKHTIDQHPANGTTIKSVDKDDKEEDPFNKAKKFYQSTVHGNVGVGHIAKNDQTSHSYALTHSGGHKHAVNNDKHYSEVHPSNGVKHSADDGKSVIKLDSSGISSNTDHAITRSAQQTITDTAQSLIHNGPTNVNGTLGISGLASMAGGLSTGALEVATDANGGLVQATMGLEVGGVSGGLSFGILPPDFADDVAAAAGGVQIKHVYRTGSILKIRVA